MKMSTIIKILENPALFSYKENRDARKEVVKWLKKHYDINDEQSSGDIQSSSPNGNIVGRKRVPKARY